jgi:hypothetical protein
MTIDTGCKIEKLGAHMLPLLERSLAAELTRMLGQWVKWDIRELAKRRKEAVKARERAEAEADADARPSRASYERPTGRDRWDRTQPQYRPPGRT